MDNLPCSSKLFTKSWSFGFDRVTGVNIILWHGRTRKTKILKITLNPVNALKEFQLMLQCSIIYIVYVILTSLNSLNVICHSLIDL